MRWAFTAFADDVDYTRERVGAVQRALRATRNLKVVDAINAQRSKVEVTSELVDLGSVDHYQVVIGISSPDKNARDTAMATGLANLDSRKFSQGLVYVLHALVFDVLPSDDTYRRADLRGECSSRRSGHDDVLLDGAYLEMQIDVPIFTWLEKYIVRESEKAGEICHQRVRSAEQAIKAVLPVGVGVAIFDGCESGKQIDANTRDDTPFGVKNLSLKGRAILHDSTARGLRGLRHGQPRR